MAKGKRHRKRGGEGCAWEALSIAVALLTARRAGPGISQAEIVGDFPAEPVIRALTMLGSAFLGDPGEPEDEILRDLGLLALGQKARAVAAAAPGTGGR